MQIGLKKLKYGFKNGTYLGLIVFFISMGLGCANTHRTTKTETTVTTYPTVGQEQKNLNNEGYIIRQQDKTVSEKSETTTTTTETEAERPGLVSSTFHAIGYVISLPFIIIGGLFRIIFGG